MKIILQRYLGMACIALGFIGIFVPILPTTPFLLLAMYLLARSSPPMAKWLLENKFLGVYLRVYMHGSGLLLRDKMRILFLLWIVVGLSGTFATSELWIRIALGVVALGVTVHILMLKSHPADLE